MEEGNPSCLPIHLGESSLMLGAVVRQEMGMQTIWVVAPLTPRLHITSSEGWVCHEGIWSSSVTTRPMCGVCLASKHIGIWMTGLSEPERMHVVQAWIVDALARQIVSLIHNIHGWKWSGRVSASGNLSCRSRYPTGRRTEMKFMYVLISKVGCQTLLVVWWRHLDDCYRGMMCAIDGGIRRDGLCSGRIYLTREIDKGSQCVE